MSLNYLSAETDDSNADIDPEMLDEIIEFVTHHDSNIHDDQTLEQTNSM